LTNKEHLKNYRKYKDLIKQYDRELAAGGLPEPEAVKALRDSYVCLVEAIEKAVAGLPDPTEQLLLRLRYVKGYSWTRVRFELHYSESQVKRYHRRALKRLEEVRLA
jgi:DNA-directed RNA polymerase specialized sigma24 family protein